MSLDTSKTVINAEILCKIELNGKTIRFARRDLIAKDTDGTFYFWEGRLNNISNLSLGMNDLKGGNTITSNISFSLFNGSRNSDDSNLDSDLDSYFWPNRTVTFFLVDLTASTTFSALSSPSYAHVGPMVYTGSGRRLGPTMVSTLITSAFQVSTSDIIFKGKVSFPDGIRSHSEDQVDISAHSEVYNNEKLVCPRVFTRAEFPTAAFEVYGLRMPVVYGEFEENIVPAYLVNISDGIFRVADPDPYDGGVWSVSLLGDLFGPYGELSEAATPDNDLAELYSNDYAKFNNTLEVFTSCDGKIIGDQIDEAFYGNLGTATLDPIIYPIEMIYDFLVNRLGIDSTDIDETSFTSASSVGQARRIFNTDIRITEAIDELCFEFGYDLYNNNGLWAINKFDTNPSSGSITLTDFDLLESPQIQYDPNKLYFNKFTIKWGYSDKEKDYTENLTFSVYEKINEHGFESSFEYDFKYAYRSADALKRIGEIASYALRPIKQVTFKAALKAFYLAPGDIFTLSSGPVSGDVMVRSVLTDLSDFTTTITGWILPTRQVKTYSSTTTAPSDYATADGLTYGIFHSDYEIVEGFNDTLSFTTDAPYQATVVAGIYTSVTELAQAIEDAMNAVSLSVAMSVDYNSTTRKFTVTRDDASNFSIEWTTDVELGRSILGFDVSADDSGSSAYTADYLAVFDSSDTERIAEYA